MQDRQRPKTLGNEIARNRSFDRICIFGIFFSCHLKKQKKTKFIALKQREMTWNEKYRNKIRKKAENWMTSACVCVRQI